MKLRTVLVLLAVLAVLAGLAIWTSRTAAPPPAPAAEKLALGGFDVNAVARIFVGSAAGSSTLVKKDGRWVVGDRFDHPADFDRLAERLRVLADLKPGDVIRAGQAPLEEFGLDPAHATHLALSAADGSLLADMMIGSARKAGPDSLYAGAPAGQYVRIGRGRLQLLGETLPLFPVSPDEWIQRTLWTLPADEISSVSLTTTQGEYTVRMTAPGAYEIDGLKKGEEPDPAAARRLVDALATPEIVTVAAPAGTNEDERLERYAVCRATLKDGRRYEIRLGAEAPNGGRFAQVAVEAAEKDAAFAGGVYVIGPDAITDLAPPRDRLVRPKQESEKAPR